MHMADALVAPAVAGVMYVCSATVAGYAVKKVRLEEQPEKIPLMGVMGAFVFAAQMINFTIPGTGSSGHLCGGMLLSAVLGPAAGFLTMIAVLLVQCLLFADGGLLALGCNIWNMAFYGCFIGSMLIWKQMMKQGVSRKKILAASVIGSIVTLQLGAFSVTLETLASGITELPFGVFVAAMQPIHLAIGLVEGLITASVLVFVYEVRPELLWGIGTVADSRKKGKLSLRWVIVLLSGAVILIGGFFSLFASSKPDGLEWSIERVAGDFGQKPVAAIAKSAQKLQEMTAVLPDYTWKNSDSAVGTSFSGIAGAVVVIVVCVGACYLLRFFMRKTQKQDC